MSQQNVALLHRGIDAVKPTRSRCLPGADGSRRGVHPYERAVEGLGPYRGHDGVRTWWEESFAALPDLSADLYEVRDLGEITFARGCLRGTGAGSGASFERTLWMAIEWRDKQEVWWHAFESEAEALEAVGLRDGVGDV